MNPHDLPDTVVLEVVNAAKAFTRAKPSRKDYWEKRLAQRVEAYVKAETGLKKRCRDKKASAKAAQEGMWMEKGGKLTPYVELTDKHLDSILNFIEEKWKNPSDHPHWDGLVAELRRRNES